MKALVKAKAGPGAELRDVPVPKTRPGTVLIKVEATSICGTDLHIYNWDAWAAGRIKPPLAFGHEFAGRVAEVGEGVTGIQPGDYVSAECHATCGQCYHCRTGQGHICKTYRILGVDFDGCFAEYVLAPAASVWKNDPSMPPEVASIQDPFGNAVLTTLSGDITGKTVAVFGVGAIGLFAVAIAQAAGACHVFAVDINDYRLALAKQVGATTVINAREADSSGVIMAATGGDGVDVVLEMSGNEDALHTGLKVLRNGGRLSLLGIPARPVQLDLASEVVFKGITIHGITGREIFRTWYQTNALLKRIDVRPIITHRFPLEAYADAFALMRTGNCGKIVLYP